MRLIRNLITLTLLLNIAPFVSAESDSGHLTGASMVSDEFDVPVDLLLNNTSNWSVLGSGVMDERATEIIIENGWLRVVPERFEFNAWFEDEYGPLVYQNITGNFSVMTHLQVVSSDNPAVPPNIGYNAGGFVIRDAVGTHMGDENWMMYNMGGQGANGVTYAREVKKTVNSTSNLFLTEQVSTEEFLLACRVGSTFYFFYWADNIQQWREEQYYNQVDVDGLMTTTWHNSSSVTPEITPPGIGSSTPLRFEHATMPGTVQLGIMGHTWSDEATQASFDYVRFANNPPVSREDCLTEFHPFDLIFEDGFE